MQLPVCYNPNITKWPNIGTVFWATVHHFLACTTRPDLDTDSLSHISDLSDSLLPSFFDKISIYTSAVASFYAPSNICGIKGMRREPIHASSLWRKGAPHYNTVLVECWNRPQQHQHERNQHHSSQAFPFISLWRHWVLMCLSWLVLSCWGWSRQIHWYVGCRVQSGSAWEADFADHPYWHSHMVRSFDWCV